MAKRDFPALIADLDAEFRLIEKARERLGKAKQRADLEPKDALLWMGFAFLLHNLYTGYEAYFLRIAKFFENGLPKDDWHKILIDRMCVDVEDLRPRFLLEEDRSAFQELRSFRHLVRHLYDREILPERVSEVYGHADYTLRIFPERHATFRETLRKMARSAAEI
jgi:hypothetical protein